MQSSPSTTFLIYQTADGHIRLEVTLQDQTLWLTQLQMAELLETTKQNISLHIGNIFEEGELVQNSTVKECLTVQQEGSRSVERKIEYYNLDLIIAVGYRVRSKRGTQFRQWATHTLKEYLVKGFVMNDERLKDPQRSDYFDEWLARIRDIRASEKRFYQKIRDLYATSVNYDTTSEITLIFFKTVQNKLLFAVTGQTAAELLSARADAAKPHMGLTSWKGSQVRKPDVLIAKNYLTPDEITELNRIVTMFLDYAEDQAKRRQAMSMKDWADRVDAFLTFNNRVVLNHAGKITHTDAEQHTLQIYQTFEQTRHEAEKIIAEQEALSELILLENKVFKQRREL